MARLLHIGIIGDYQADRPSHIATIESLNHCADYLGCTLILTWLPTESLEAAVDKNLCKFDGLWCAPGEYNSMEGALRAIRYVRENNIPFIGTCQGFQHMVIEYVRNKLGIKDAQHVEFNPEAPNLIITTLSCSFVGETRKVIIQKGSRVSSYYAAEATYERFTCNSGINPSYRKMIDDSGCSIVGTDENGEIRILDLLTNNFFIATLFQPQLSLARENPHKLILAFLTHSQHFHSAHH